MRRVNQIGDLLKALVNERGLRVHDRWTRAELALHQRRQLQELVRHALEHSRLYRELYRGLTLGAEIDLQALPVTNKQLIMGNFNSVVTDPRLKLDALRAHLESIRRDEYYLEEYRVLATTGTSGLRGVFVYDRVAWSKVLANTLRWNRFTGIRPSWPRTRVCTIGADHPMHVSHRIPESADVGLFKMMRLTATDPLPKLVGALNAFQPHVMMPYPSVAALLADEQIAGRLCIRPKIVTTHSELLTEEMARRIQAAWGIKPFDHYGLTEEPHVGIECMEHRGLHLLEDLCIVEVVDENNRPVEPGTLGRKYLLTNLYNKVQPLIRYEVSDMLIKSPNSCPCGRPFSLVTQLGGRSEDMLDLRDQMGRRVVVPPMLLTLAIDAVPGVAEYQAAHGPDGIHLEVVPRPDVDRDRLHAALGTGIRTAIAALGAMPPSIDVAFVEKLERRTSHMGKIRLVGATGRTKA